MAKTEAQKRSAIRYNAEHTRQINLRFVTTGGDDDILARLDSIDNKQGYIKSLIRADIARANSTTTRANSNMMKEDSTMKYNAINTAFFPTFDHDPNALHIHEPSAQNPDDPGIPAGTGPRWFAVVQSETDDWSNGAKKLEDAVELARNLDDAKILAIDNTEEHPFVTDEIDPRKTYHILPEYIDQWGAEANSETVVTLDDVLMCARGWEVPVEEVLEQLEEI